MRIVERKPYKLKGSQKFYRFLKAWADFFIALVAIIILSPVFVITAIAIKIDSKGPVFFKQPRIGKNGKLFNCIKFRSMSTEARHDVAGYEYAEVNSYITKVGKVIRKLSIDELPQLFNMLTFKMSLIGYRPSQSNEIELNTAREDYDMYQVRPGITGWAQVNGFRGDTSIRGRIDCDLYYIENWTVGLDFKILFLTVFKGFVNKNAY